MLSRGCCAVAHAHLNAAPACFALVTAPALSVMLTLMRRWRSWLFSVPRAISFPPCWPNRRLQSTPLRVERDRGDFTRSNLLQCHRDLLGGAAEAQLVGPILINLGLK